MLCLPDTPWTEETSSYGRCESKEWDMTDQLSATAVIGQNKSVKSRYNTIDISTKEHANRINQTQIKMLNASSEDRMPIKTQIDIYILARMSEVKIFTGPIVLKCMFEYSFHTLLVRSVK